MSLRVSMCGRTHAHFPFALRVATQMQTACTKSIISPGVVVGINPQATSASPSSQSVITRGWFSRNSCGTVPLIESFIVFLSMQRAGVEPAWSVLMHPPPAKPRVTDSNGRDTPVPERRPRRTAAKRTGGLVKPPAREERETNPAAPTRRDVVQGLACLDRQLQLALHVQRGSLYRRRNRFCDGLVVTLQRLVHDFHDVLLHRRVDKPHRASSFGSP